MNKINTTHTSIFACLYKQYPLLQSDYSALLAKFYDTTKNQIATPKTNFISVDYLLVHKFVSLFKGIKTSIISMKERENSIVDNNLHI